MFHFTNVGFLNALRPCHSRFFYYKTISILPKAQMYDCYNKTYFFILSMGKIRMFYINSIYKFTVHYNSSLAKKTIMKRQITMLAACAICHTSIAQSLILKGATPSVQKGDINTEVLTGVIQEKQKEIKQRVFKNSVIRVFKKNDYTEDFNNFASYHYLYNVMDALVSNTNKTTITKSLVENTTEFAVVYAATLYAKQKLTKPGSVRTFSSFTNKSIYGREGNKEMTTLTLSPNTFKNAESKIVVNKNIITGKEQGNKLDFNKEDMKKTNLLMDICYDIIAKDPAWQKEIQFKDNPYKDKDLEVWYNGEYGNVYLYELEEAKKHNPAYAAELTALRADIAKILTDILPKVVNTSAAIPEVKDFLNGLSKSKYKDFSMTKEQFESMKFLVDEFLKIAKNKFSNDLVVSIIGSLLDNSVMEFVNANGVPVDNSASAISGFLAINVESVITALDGKFSVDNKHSFTTYFRPMFSIGINYLSFPTANNLNATQKSAAVNDETNLSTVTIATEKIGVEWILFNWKYKRCHKAGDMYYYYGHQCINEQPSKQPLFSNVFLNGYAGGLLYNIVRTKSNQNFDYAIVGASAGVTFYNGLKLSAGVGQVIQDDLYRNMERNRYYNVGVDVPIFDYIAALRNKKE